MLAFKKDTLGGFLSLPEYGIGLEIADNSVLIFDGQNITHGVTPITKLGKESYRYTVVYYSLQQMWHCLTQEEELERVRNRRVESEGRRARGELSETTKSQIKDWERKGYQRTK